jgi:hypothetical protein
MAARRTPWHRDAARRLTVTQVAGFIILPVVAMLAMVVILLVKGV